MPSAHAFHPTPPPHHALEVLGGGAQDLVPALLPLLVAHAQQVAAHGCVALGIGQLVGVDVTHGADDGLQGTNMRVWHVSKCGQVKCACRPVKNGQTGALLTFKKKLSAVFGKDAQGTEYSWRAVALRFCFAAVPLPAAPAAVLPHNVPPAYRLPVPLPPTPASQPPPLTLVSSSSSKCRLRR